MFEPSIRAIASARPIPSRVAPLRRPALLALLLALAACSNDNGTEAPPVDAPTVTVRLDPAAPEPGQTVIATVLASPADGDRLTRLRMQVSGMLTLEDSVAVASDGSASMTRSFVLPRDASPGQLTVVGSAISAARRTGTGEYSVAIRDDAAPTLVARIVAPPGVGTDTLAREPGDSVVVILEARDNIALRYSVVRVTGAFTATDSMAHGTANFASRAVRLKIPVSAALGGQVNVSVTTADYAEHVTRVDLVPLSYADRRPPVVRGTVLGGRNGTLGFTAGDELVLQLAADDNHRLARVGYRFGAPATGADSFPVSAASFTREVRVTVPAAWAGSPALTVFAVDSSGNRREFPAAVLTVASRTRRAMVSGALTASVRDIAIDTRRGVAYLSVPAERRIAVQSLATGEITAGYTFTAATAGLDLSASGDSLLVAVAGTPQLTVINLATGQRDTIRVINPGDTRSPDNVRVMANGVALVSITFAGSGYGGSLIELDLLTRARQSRLTVTEAVPIARSGNRTRALVLIDDSCCPLGAFVYDAASRSFTPERGTVQRYFPAASANYAGDRFMVHATVFDQLVSTIGSFQPSVWDNGSTAIAAAGTSAFYSTSTGLTHYQFATGSVLETFALGGTASRPRVSDDGITLVTQAAGRVHVIDLW